MNVLVTGKTGVQIGNNTNLFDWTYIENAAHAHLLAADRLSPSHPKFSQVAGQAFFISNNDPRPYWDFPRALWKAAGHTPSRITVLPKPIAMIIAILMEFFCWLTGREALLTRFRVTYVCLTRWCNTSKAREALDYEPPVPLNEGIKRSVEVRASIPSNYSLWTRIGLLLICRHSFGRNTRLRLRGENPSSGIRCVALSAWRMFVISTMHFIVLAQGTVSSFTFTVYWKS